MTQKHQEDYQMASRDSSFPKMVVSNGKFIVADNSLPSESLTVLLDFLFLEWEDTHATCLSIKSELLMLKTVINFTISHCLDSVSARAHLVSTGLQRANDLSEAGRSCPWCWTHSGVQIRNLLSLVLHWIMNLLCGTFMFLCRQNTAEFRRWKFLFFSQLDTEVVFTLLFLHLCSHSDYLFVPPSFWCDCVCLMQILEIIIGSMWLHLMVALCIYTNPALIHGGKN